MAKLNVKENLDRLLVMMFLKSGEKESNLEKAEIMKIEEEIEKGRFKWNVVEKMLLKYKIEQEQDMERVNETNYVGGNYRDSRRDFKKFRDNTRYYKSPGGRFHKSSSRYQSSSKSRGNNENRSPGQRFHSNQRSLTPNAF